MSHKKEYDWSFVNDLSPVMVLRKKYAKTMIEYYIDPEEGWFIYVVTRGIKSRSIEHVSMIIRKDVPDWLRYQKNHAWVPDNEYNFLEQENETN